MRLALLLAGMVGITTASWAQTNNVTGANGFSDYIINGQNDPAFTLQRGVTYVFRLGSLPTHPFWIKTAPGFGSANAYNDGVVNNGATFGDITFTVPANAPDVLIYQCGNHASMLGTLNIATPPSPPTVRIVHIAVGQNVVVTSTGAAGWNVIPEYMCDLASGTWTAVAPFTNTFASGTNTTSFGRLEAVCGSPNILIRIRNQQN
jgi:hypothetical protein